MPCLHLFSPSGAEARDTVADVSGNGDEKRRLDAEDRGCGLHYERGREAVFRESSTDDEAAGGEDAWHDG
jgi:hypothetical protein